LKTHYHPTADRPLRIVYQTRGLNFGIGLRYDAAYRGLGHSKMRRWMC